MGKQYGLGLGATYTLPRLIQVSWASFTLSAALATSPLLILHLPHRSLGTLQLRAHGASDRALLEELSLHLLAI